MQIINSDCLSALRDLPDASVDAVVTDPPYGLSNTSPDKVADTICHWVNGNREFIPQGKGFMGKAWDAFVPPVAVWDECLRVLKPGGHMAVFAGTRTQDLMGLAIRLAGFEIRDSVAWLYGSGFPKSLNISKAMDRAAGKLAPEGQRFTVAGYSHNPEKILHTAPSQGYTPPAPVTDEAAQWQGWGTALKPGHEPIIIARKPFKGTVAQNVLEHGTGGLNIDATRTLVNSDDPLTTATYVGSNPGSGGHTMGDGWANQGITYRCGMVKGGGQLMWCWMRTKQTYSTNRVE